jgi:hypothetical protein
MMGSATKNPPTSASFARCDFCGRENRIPDTWLPTPCAHCGRLHFPASSRARLAATIAGIVAVVVATVVAWWIAL